MSGKIVKASGSAAQAPMKNRERTRWIGLWEMKDFGRSFNVFSLRHFLGQSAGWQYRNSKKICIVNGYIKSLLRGTNQSLFQNI